MGEVSWGGVCIWGMGGSPLSLSLPHQAGNRWPASVRGALRAAGGALVSGRRWWVLVVEVVVVVGLIIKELFEAVQNLAGAPAGGSGSRWG